MSKTEKNCIKSIQWKGKEQREGYVIWGNAEMQ